MEAIHIIISAIFVNNVILIQFLGLCPFFGVSGKLKPAIGMSAAVILVMTLASMITWMIYRLILERFSVEFLEIILFIFVIASIVQILELLMKRYIPSLHKTLGIYLPLITTNCAILGVAFLNIMNEYTFTSSIIHGFSSGIGFMIALLLMAGIRERLDLGDVPKSFKGVPIAFMTAGIISLAFLGIGTFLS